MPRAKLPLHEVEVDHNWSKPLVGMIKCNVAPLLSTITPSWDVICVLDYARLLLLGKSYYFHSSATVLEAGNTDLLKVIKVAISNRRHAVLFEMDCKSLLDDICSVKVPLNEFGDLVFQCISLLLNRFDFVVSHVRRQTNRVAHCIARTSLSHPSPVFSIMYQLLCIR